MTLPSLTGEVRVTLGGTAWTLADLAPRQYRKVIPALIGLGTLATVADLDEGRIDRLVEAYYWALTRAQPTLTREQWDEVPVSVIEMIEALPVLAEKAGLVPRRDAASGEARAPTPPNGAGASTI